MSFIGQKAFYYVTLKWCFCRFGRWLLSLRWVFVVRCLCRAPSDLIRPYWLLQTNNLQGHTVWFTSSTPTLYKSLNTSLASLAPNGAFHSWIKAGRGDGAAVLDESSPPSDLEMASLASLSGGRVSSQRPVSSVCTHSWKLISLKALYLQPSPPTPHPPLTPPPPPPVQLLLFKSPHSVWLARISPTWLGVAARSGGRANEREQLHCEMTGP